MAKRKLGASVSTKESINTDDDGVKHTENELNDEIAVTSSISAVKKKRSLDAKKRRRQKAKENSKQKKIQLKLVQV